MPSILQQLLGFVSSCVMPFRLVMLRGRANPCNPGNLYCTWASWQEKRVVKHTNSSLLALIVFFSVSWWQHRIGATAARPAAEVGA